MATTTNTTIVTFCEGDTYERVQETWTKRVRERCGGRHDIQVLRSNPVVRNMLHVEKAYAWWDVERLHAVISLLRAGNRVAHIDLDVVVERDLAPLFELNPEGIHPEIKVPYSSLWEDFQSNQNFDLRKYNIDKLYN